MCVRSLFVEFRPNVELCLSFSTKVSIDSLESEIAAMEEEIARTKISLSQLSKNQASTEAAKDLMASHLSSHQKMKTSEPETWSMARKYMSTKGLHKWKPVLLTDHKLSFHFVGPSPEACVELCFSLATGQGIRCEARIDASLFGTQKGNCSFTRYRVLAGFFRLRTDALCDEVSNRVLADASEIKEVLRSLDWQLGRLEHTAAELMTLRLMRLRRCPK